MTMKMGGWQRLWVIISGIYLIAVIVAFIFIGPRFPREQEISGRATANFYQGAGIIGRLAVPGSRWWAIPNDFYSELGPESREKLAGHPGGIFDAAYLADVEKVFTTPSKSERELYGETADDLQEASEQKTPEQLSRVGGSLEYVSIIDPDILSTVRTVLAKRAPEQINGMPHNRTDLSKTYTSKVPPSERAEVDRADFDLQIMTEKPIDFTLIPEADLSALRKKDFDSVSTPTLQYLSTADESYLVTNVKMPNGDMLTFRKRVSEKERKAVAEAYWNLVKAETNKRQARYLFFAFLDFAVPVMAVYALGWSFGRAFRWVRGGFKGE